MYAVQVDNTTFATVLELCEGGDLEAHLQQHHVSKATLQASGKDLCSTATCSSSGSTSVGLLCLL